MKRNGNFELVAFCDLLEERALKAKEEYGTEDARVYTDYQELLKEDVEAVYVLTPNSSHAPISIAAMEAGKHVRGPPPCFSSSRNTPQVGTALLLMACALA